MSQTSTLKRGTKVDKGSKLQSLFRVNFRHDYYNLNDNRCDDFKVVPAPETAALIKSVGLIIDNQSDGFGVYLPSSRKAALLSAIADNETAKLSFFLLLNNPEFIGVTDLPIDTNRSKEAIYVSNLQSNENGGMRYFGTGKAIDAHAIVPSTGSNIQVNNDVVGIVTVKDISGERVVSAKTGTNNPSLSLAKQPFGLYAVSGSPASTYSGPYNLLYLPSKTSPMAFVDLLLKQPTGSGKNTAAFPLSGKDQSISTVDLVLNFNSRSTYWNYYIVAQQPGKGFDPDLAITGTGSQFNKSSVELPNGDHAISFIATQAMPMLQKATSQYKLSGSFIDLKGRKRAINIVRLPSAPTTPIWPVSEDNSKGRSEIFVYV